MQISTKLLEEIKRRRDRIFDEMPSSSIAILPGAGTQWRNGDAEYPFRQESHFYYLTGFCEPDAVLLLSKSEKGEGETILFCKASNPEEEAWTGPRLGLKGAREYLGLDKSFDITELEERMPELIANRSHFLYTLAQDEKFDKKMMRWVRKVRSKNRKGVSTPKVWIDLKSMIDQLRLRKSTYEIELMQEAASISAKAHLELMKKCKPGIWEYQLETEFLYYCANQGVNTLAYNTIVGGGENACVLHYTQNDQQLKEGDLVLIDAGCEYQYYAADITRTFPVSGRFSEKQRAIYELVLKAQVAAIELIRPGVYWDALQTVIVKIITQGLMDLGLLKGKLKEELKEEYKTDPNGILKTLLDQKAYERFYMHSSGHWLGLDVHDTGEYKVNGQWIALEPGMVLTVEPGIYIRANQADIDKSWWGIGVRIEDDVLVTETGYQVLSREVPKTVEEIEKVMSKNSHNSKDSDNSRNSGSSDYSRNSVNSRISDNL
jgi:Xaa-Pro aminopeptidase